MPSVHYEVSNGIDGPSISSHCTVIGAKRNCKVGHYIHKYVKNKWYSTLDASGTETNIKPINR